MAYSKPREKLMQLALTRKRKLGHNTYLEVLDPVSGPFGDLAIRFYETHILTYCSDGQIVIDVNGWKTRTTKDRLNEWLPSGWSIVQRAYQWYLSYSRDRGRDLLFIYADPIIIYPGGRVAHGPAPYCETEIQPVNP